MNKLDQSGWPSVSTLNKQESNSVAVVGIGCRFPGGVDGPRAYWDFLVGKNCGIVEVPSQRWNFSAHFDADPDCVGKSRSKWGGFLTDDVFGFDPTFFDMSPREALSMDPQQRLLLQVAYEAVQDAGTTLGALQRARTGVFVGISTSDFGLTQRYRRNTLDIFAGTGSAMSIAANRISHRLDLSGPSMAIDTACSSALVAVDQAMRHLNLGSCDLALAGGVNCMLDPGAFVAFSSANMLSPTGAIYAFDERADGFVRGEGCGLVLLKPLARAIADQDRIYGVIRASAVNQDGRTPTLTSPSDAAQAAMLEDLANAAGIDPDDVGFVEAHGTGTPVGDPTEASAIGRTFGQRRADGPVLVGSFKPNLGHLESASGIAGLIKVVLSTHHGIVLPNRNFERPNPNIPFDALNIAVPVEPKVFENGHGATLAIVNSFGFGGTNACVAVESWKGRWPSQRAMLAPVAGEPGPVFVPISAASKTALGLWASQLAEAADDGGPLADVHYEQIATQLKVGRDHFAERAAILADPERRDLAAKLRSLAGGAEAGARTEDAGPTIIVGRAAKQRRLAFAFSGQGGQWWAMGRQLLQNDPLYLRTVDTFDEVFRPLAGFSVVQEMLRTKAESRINDPDVTQAAIFANQIGLYQLWKSRGLTPELLVGHSFGEVAATYIAGAIDLETAARIVHQRGFIPGYSTRRGAMAAIGLTVEQLAPLLPNDESAVIGAFNGPTAQTITGMEDAVEAVLAEVGRRYPDALARRHTMNFGWHSAHMDDSEAGFRSGLGPVACKDPKIPIVSTVTGVFETRFDLEYWWQNLRRPVSFKKAVDFCLDLGIDAFLELGPHRTVTPLIHGIAQERQAWAVAVASLDRTAEDSWTMARSMASLFVAGVSFDWSAGAHAQVDKQITLPKSPWTNEQLCQLPLEARTFLFEGARHPLLGWREIAPEPIWTNEISLKGFKYLGDHRVLGDCLFPAVGYVEMMAAALRDQFGAGPVELRDLQILEALSIGDDDSIVLRTTFDPATHRLRISSMQRDTAEEWRLRAQAYGWRHDFGLAPPAFDPAIFAAPPAMERGEFYRLTALHGLEYGPTFQAVEQTWLISDERSVTRVRCSEAERRSGYVAFPGLLDAMLQSAIPLYDKDEGLWRPGEALPDIGKNGACYPLRLPVGMRKVLVAGPLPSDVTVESRAFRTDSSTSYRVYAPDGTPLLAVENLYTKGLGAARPGAKHAKGVPTVLEEYFIAASAPDTSAAKQTTRSGRWLLVGGDPRVTDPLAAAMGRRGIAIETLDLGPLSAMDTEFAAAAIERLCSEPAGLSGIVFVPGASALSGTDASVPTDRLLGAVETSTLALVTLGQVLDRLRMTAARPQLVVLTRGARRLCDDAPTSLEGLADSTLIGLGRTIANECQEFAVRLIDADADAFAQADALAGAVVEDGPETEMVLRGSARHVPRLAQKALEKLVPLKRHIAVGSDASNYTVTMSAPGVIDNVVLRETAFPEPGFGEVAVEVAAAGLNFRDIMAATGVLPDEIEGENAWWRNLGLEFAGTVRAVGAGVERLHIGDRVMGMGRGLLRRFARLPAAAAIPLPAEADLVAAATLPAAFITAHYALHTVARLEKGESVLIHLASGGVGLAAIQVARHLGAEIFATAGSDRKRDHLRSLGIAHVMNSRGLEFAEQVRTATNGRGVDVVLNALSGPGIDKGLECLAPFGRFVEIGKRDLAQDKPIGLRSLYCNNSYSVIDLSTLGVERPDLLRRLLDEFAERVTEGIYRPLVATAFPASKAADAMRMLAKAQHIGKIVVTFDEPEVEVELDIEQPMRLAADASYLVTGGLRGFGVAVADWLSRQGAGRLLLAGRAGTIDPAAQPVFEAVAARGTEVVPVALDVTDYDAVAALVAAQAAGDRPLRGIVHGAAVIEDGFLSQLDVGQIERVLRPKVAGAWNLHLAAARAGAQLDFFVSFSSLAALIGSPGQANYTAANSFLNGIAGFRRSRGLPASTVAWGAIGGSGFVARSEALASYLDSIGMKTIADNEAAAALDSLLRAENETPTFAGVDWSVVARAMPRAGADPRLQPLVAEQAGGRSRIQSELAMAPRSSWERILSDLIRGEVAKVLKVDTAAIPSDRKLTELGLDSLSSFELKNRIEAQIEINIPVAKFLQAPTISGLASIVAGAVDAHLKANAAVESAIAAMGADGARERGEDEAFRPLARQRVAVALSERPMTSAIARGDCDVAASLASGPGIGFSEIAEALARLAEAQDAIRLCAMRLADGRVDVALAEPPRLERIESEADLRPVPAIGALWRFGATLQADGVLRLHARAHRAAADALSPQLALAALAAAAKTGTITPPRQAFAGFAQERQPAEGSGDHLRHLVFWKEQLRTAPPLLALPGRARAPAPTGFGMNRGPMGYIGTEMIAPEFSGLEADEQEAKLVAAFCLALGRMHQTSAFVLERHDAARRDAGPVDLIGPVADSFPLLLTGFSASTELALRRAQRALLLGRAHRALDTAAIEALLENDLRKRNTDLRQIGFCFLDARGIARMKAGGFSDPLAAVAQASNEIRLDVAAEEQGIRLQLCVDTDVVDRAYAEALVAAFAAEFGPLSGRAARPSIPPAALRWVEPSSKVFAPPPRDTVRAPSADPLTSARPALARALREVPVSIKQRSLLRLLLRPDASAAYRACWCLSRAFRVRPQIDLARMKRALAILVDRHDALRTRFTLADGGSLHAFIEAPDASSYLAIEDMEGSGEAAVLKRVSELDKEQIDPFHDPLYRLTVLRCGPEGDVIHARVHHSIADGWSLGLLVEEMFQAFMGMTLSPVEMSIEDYVLRFEKAGDPVALAEREAYLRTLYSAPIPRIPNLGRKARGLAPNVDMVHAGPSGELVTFATPEGEHRVRERARASGVTENSLLLAALAQTLASRAEVDDVILSVPVAMRTDRRMTNLVSWVASWTLLRAPASSARSLETLAAGLGEQLNRSIQHLPFDHEMAEGPLHDEIVASGSYFRLYFAGMQTVDRFVRGTSSASFQRQSGTSGEIDFGLGKISPIGSLRIESETINELDLRSFHGPDGLGYRCGYDLLAFDRTEAQAIFAEVLDRLGLMDGGCGSIMATDEEQ